VVALKKLAKELSEYLLCGNFFLQKKKFLEPVALKKLAKELSEYLLCGNFFLQKKKFLEPVALKKLAKELSEYLLYGNFFLHRTLLFYIGNYYLRSRCRSQWVSPI